MTTSGAAERGRDGLTSSDEHRVTSGASLFTRAGGRRAARTFSSGSRTAAEQSRNIFRAVRIATRTARRSPADRERKSQGSKLDAGWSCCLPAIP